MQREVISDLLDRLTRQPSDESVIDLLADGAAQLLAPRDPNLTD